MPPLSEEQKAKMAAGRKAAAEKRRQVARVEPPAPVASVAEPGTKPGTDLSRYSTDGDLVDIWERRMLNPHQKASGEIHITTPGMHIRWINRENKGRYQRARYEEGWVPVHRDELKDEKEIYGVTFTVEGHVCRGERMTEMLMKMPEAVYRKIQKSKYAEVEKSNKRIKQSLQEAAASKFSDKYDSSTGHRMADQFDAPRGQTGAFRGEIKFGTEQVSPEGDEGVILSE